MAGHRKKKVNEATEDKDTWEYHHPDGAHKNLKFKVPKGSSQDHARTRAMHINSTARQQGGFDAARNMVATPEKVKVSKVNESIGDLGDMKNAKIDDHSHVVYFKKGTRVGTQSFKGIGVHADNEKDAVAKAVAKMNNKDYVPKRIRVGNERVRELEESVKSDKVLSIIRKKKMKKEEAKTEIKGSKTATGQQRDPIDLEPKMVDAGVAGVKSASV